MKLALRAVLLAFLVAGVAPCAASEASGPETETDFTVSISEKGVEENGQRVFSLGPSASLRVVDESNKAIFLPQPTTAQQDTAAQYSFAYVFENGHCNFGKKVAFTDVFPGYSQPLWVRTATEGSMIEGPTERVAATYKFTNPPAEYLSKAVSFCVRFTTSSAATTATTTASPTTPTVTTPQAPTSPTGPSTDSTSSESSSSGSGDSGGSSPGAGNSGSSSPGQNGQVGDDTPVLPNAGSSEESPQRDGRGSDKVLDENEEGGQDDDGTDVAPLGAAAPAPGHPSAQLQSGTEGAAGQSPPTGVQLAEEQVTPEKPKTESSHSANSMASSKEPTATAKPSEPTAHPSASVQTTGQPDTGGDSQNRLRRLSDTDASEVKYLTVIVHSNAVFSVPGKLTLSAAFLSILAPLLVAW
ncbi:UNVERIFIED_CONTAM: Toxoplasma gondii family A protein [Hammondia hammondi]|eukprot:XP_008884381.1 Toxoplasma gondii family A protein [Hammondia hammondi]